MYERWASGVFFTQTKPPSGEKSTIGSFIPKLNYIGPFWDRLNEEMFSSLSFHTVDPEEVERLKEEKKRVEDEEMAEKIRARLIQEKQEKQEEDQNC